MTLEVETVRRVPSWHLIENTKEAQKLYGSVFYRWVGETFTASDISLTMLRDMVSSYFELDTEAQNIAVWSSLCHLRLRELQDFQAKMTAMSLVWNKDLLKSGIPIMHGMPDFSQPTWVPFSIRNVTFMSLYGRDVAKLNLSCIGGRFAGNTASRTVPKNYLYVLSRKLGYRGSTFSLGSADEQLQRLWFAGLCVTESQKLQFSTFRVTAAMKKYNDTIIEQRTTDEALSFVKADND